MTGASFEAGYMNIGTSETSSQPKIESHINLQIAEAIGDSNDVCGLERKECDEIMEHLKNNPGLVVKSLDPEGKSVLHIAVIACETKKPKPPTSKCTKEGFSEASHDSDWYHALRKKDCRALMSLLQVDPCFVMQTGPEGWTVLHAAAHRGCLQLLDQVFDLFKDNRQFVDKVSKVKIAFSDLLKAKCGKFEAKAYDIAWFTCPRQVFEALDAYSDYNFGESFSATQQSSSDASQHLRDKLVEIMQGETSKIAFESLEEDYQSDTNYNFVLECKELQFHYACEKLYQDAAKDYVKTIIDGCLNLEPSESVEVLTYLYQLHNAQGLTPINVACYVIDDFLKLVPSGNAYKECLNARDVRGWNVIHSYAARGYTWRMEQLLKDERIDVNARTKDIQTNLQYPTSNMTALHLAILHKDLGSVKLLLQCSRTDVNAVLKRDIMYGPSYQIRSLWSPLQLAAIMGLSNVVRALLGPKLCCDIHDEGKLQYYSNVLEEDLQNVSTLLLASASGNPDTLRLFLDNPMFNPLDKFEGATALHYATNAMTPLIDGAWVDRFLLSSALECLDIDTCRYEEELENNKLNPSSYLGRQACITMLLQVGVDIWEKDNEGRLAEPGPQAPKEAQLWWHQKMAQETLEAKKSLNDAANAIAVVAALVATASFVGPLQPPLGYGGGGVQDTHLSIRVFMVSNNLSFYFAIASILFAVVPSLPMPQEGIYVEWQRTRRTVAMAIFFLLLSVLGVLISFGAASNCVVSEDYSWQHDGLLFYPTLVGGFICMLGIGLFFLRLLRLVFTRNEKIRYLYKTFVRF